MSSCTFESPFLKTISVIPIAGSFIEFSASLSLANDLYAEAYNLEMAQKKIQEVRLLSQYFGFGIARNLLACALLVSLAALPAFKDSSWLLMILAILPLGCAGLNFFQMRTANMQNKEFMDRVSLFLHIIAENQTNELLRISNGI